MSVERAAEVILRVCDLRGIPASVIGSRGIAQALADAGLLLSDADRAVLDAAVARDVILQRYRNGEVDLLRTLGEANDRLDAAVRARRDAAQSLTAERNPQ